MHTISPPPSSRTHTNTPCMPVYYACVHCVFIMYSDWIDIVTRIQSIFSSSSLFKREYICKYGCHIPWGIAYMFGATSLITPKSCHWQWVLLIVLTAKLFCHTTCKNNLVVTFKCFIIRARVVYYCIDVVRSHFESALVQTKVYNPRSATRTFGKGICVVMLLSKDFDQISCCNKAYIDQLSAVAN